jgi:hypothetical protein
LPEIFGALTADLTNAGYLVNRSRPLIEYYRRVDELVIKVPVSEGDGAG